MNVDVMEAIVQWRRARRAAMTNTDESKAKAIRNELSKAETILDKIGAVWDNE